jgi:hypothetical protein
VEHKFKQSVLLHLCNSRKRNRGLTSSFWEQHQTVLHVAIFGWLCRKDTFAVPVTILSEQKETLFCFRNNDLSLHGGFPFEQLFKDGI